MVMNVHFARPVKLSHKLVCGAWGDEASEQLNRLVFHRSRDLNFVSFLIRFPLRAVYLFSIFAAPLGKVDPEADPEFGQTGRTRNLQKSSTCHSGKQSVQAQN